MKNPVIGIKTVESRYTVSQASSNDPEVLKNCKRINIFVGKNNSGKSFFLRGVFEKSDHVIFDKSEKNLQALIRITSEYKEKYPEAISNKNFPYVDQLIELTSWKGGYGWATTLSKKVQEWEEKSRKNPAYKLAPYGINDKQFCEELVGKIKSELPYSGFKEKNWNPHHIYIPILRGLRPLVKESYDNNIYDFHESNRVPPSNCIQYDCYAERTVKDYFSKSDDDPAPRDSVNIFGDNPTKTIFTGLGIFNEIKRMLLGKQEERNKVGEFQDFLTREFFPEGITLIPEIKKDSLLVQLGDDEKPVFELGDGIQTIICATFPLFMHSDEPVILCVEEPELTLHPSMQRRLVESYLSFPNATIFATTHSNHFLDLLFDHEEDISIFSFEPFRDEDNNKNFLIDEVTPRSNIENLLGIRNSSIFLTNSIIWVEGVTDRIYLRALLEIYKGSEGVDWRYKEDAHYAFCEYGGINRDNFDFKETEDVIHLDTSVHVGALHKSNFVVADNDLSYLGKSAGDARLQTNKEKLLALKKLLGKSFFDGHVEIENLIPFTVWYRYLNSKISDKSGLKIRSDALKNEKAFNDGLDKEKIGTLLKNNILSQKDKRRKLEYYKKDSIECIASGVRKKTIALEVTTLLLEMYKAEEINFESLPDITKKLLMSLHEFIDGSNKRTL